MSIVKKILKEALSEDVKHLDYLKTKDPVKDTDKIRVYHGFGGYAKYKGIAAIKYGLSCQERADRAYSYESVNNPKGLFVTINFKVAERQFAGSGIIIEFDTIASNLEAPVWAGQDSFFVPGQYTSGFEHSTIDAERKAAQERKRKEYTDNDPEDARYGNNRVSKSDRPELAASLFVNGEQQALFVGHLDPNQIKYVWYHEGRFAKNTTLGEWVRMTRNEFLRKIIIPIEQKEKEAKNSYGRSSYYDSPLFKGEQKYFRPNEDFSKEKFDVFLSQNKYKLTTEKYFDLVGDDMQHITSHFWPKQIEQLRKLNLIK